MFNYQVLRAYRGKPDSQVPRDVRVLRNKQTFLWTAGAGMLAVISLTWLLYPELVVFVSPTAPLLYLVSLFVAKPIIERKTT